MENMNIDKIIENYAHLNEQLKQALSTMERKDDVQKIRLKIKENQNNCPHASSKYNWAIIDERCPYCGKKLTNN